MHKKPDEDLLPQLVEIIFKKMSLRYGRDFLARYEGLDLDEVIADWIHELRGCEKNPMAIHFALQNLPDNRPPNVAEFRALARRAPAPNEVLALDRPVVDVKRVDSMLGNMRERLGLKPFVRKAGQ